MAELTQNEAKTFEEIRDAFSYLVNDCWDQGLLTPEQRKELRVPKNAFNHGRISYNKMIELLHKYGEFKQDYIYHFSEGDDKRSETV